MIAACCASGLIAAACASFAPEAPLSGTRWTAQSISGRPVGERAPTIEFSADRISGTGSCNRYFGSYEVGGEGDALQISQIGSTEMACEGPIMAQEQAYFAALSATHSYRLVEDTLVLSGADGSRIVFRAG